MAQVGYPIANGDATYLLPVGSVVIVDGIQFPVVLVGRGQLAKDGSVWDYLGYPYPEGYVSEKQSLLFSRDRIVNVVFEGMRSKGDDALVAQIEKVLAQVGTNR